jgi:hypothetical protein
VCGIMGEDELRRRVDDELRAYLRCVDEYQTSSAEIAAACKSGLFDIAQARKVHKHTHVKMMIGSSCSIVLC